MKKDQSHITQMFLLGKHKSKNPTIIYYVNIMDHETISYKTLLQELSVQYTIVSHCHTKIGLNMQQFTASWQPASTAQSLLITITEWIRSFLALTAQSSLAYPICVWLQVCTHYSHNWYSNCPFHLSLNWVSNGSEMHVVNSSKYSIACEIIPCELI